MNHNAESSSVELNPMDKLLSKLSEQSVALTKQSEALKTADDSVAYSRTVDYVSAASSLPITPAVASFGYTQSNTSTAPTTSAPSLSGDGAPQQSADEVLRLKLELEAAKGRIARMDQELAQGRITKHTIDQAIGPPAEFDFPVGHPADVGPFHNMNTGRPQVLRDNSWAAQDDSRSDTSDSFSNDGFNRARAIWGKQNPQQGPITGFHPAEALASGQWINRSFTQPFAEAPMQYPGATMSQYPGHFPKQEPGLVMAQPRRSNAGGRFNNRAVGSFAGSNSSYDGYTPSTTPFGSQNSMMGVPMSMGISTTMPGVYPGYQPQPIGTPLSPHAAEFTTSGSGSGWKNDVSINVLFLVWNQARSVHAIIAHY